MTRGRGLLLAVGLAILLVGVAYVLTRGRGVVADRGGEDAPLLPELRDKGDAVTAIEIVGGGPNATSVRLERAGDEWVLPDEAGYPALGDRVREFVRQLAGLRQGTALTANKSRHAELGLEVSEKEGAGTVVRVFAGGDQPITEIVFGSSRFGSESSYVRRLGEDQTWRAKGSVHADADSSRWLDPILVSFPQAEIGTIEVDSFTIRRDEGNAWVVDVPEGAGLDQAKRDEATRLWPDLLARLEMDSVRAIRAAPAEHIARYRIGNRTLTLELLAPESGASTDGATAAPERRWLRLMLGDPEPGAPLPEGVVAETIGKIEGAALRAKGREFRLPTWRATRIDEWFKPAPPDPPDPPTAP